MKYFVALRHNTDSIISLLMKPLLRYSLFIAILFSQTTFGQNPISLEYTDVALREEFSQKNDNWPYLTTMENLYVPDKDEYFMHRRHKSNPYAILTNWKNSLSIFNILTTLKLGPSETKDQTIGVIFLVQGDGKGAIAFEINKFKQYRVKQLVGSYYKFLTGDNESQGWVKSSHLASKNDYNQIDIRVNLPQVDIYLNKKFIKSFDVMDYKPGSMGFLIGADTKAKADYFYVYSTPEAKKQAEVEIKSEEQSRSAVEQLSKLRYELEQEKRTLHECQLERQAAVGRLEEDLAELRQSNDRLKLNNRQLQEFKNQVLIDVDEDVFLTLAESLKTEIVKNQRLENQVQVYKDSLKYTHVRYNRLKLALLDKAIKKAEKDHIERERSDSEKTKSEIEKELKDKRLKAEQEAWEGNKPSSSTPKTSISKTIPKETSAPPSMEDVIEELGDRPLPVKIRKAQKKQD